LSAPKQQHHPVPFEHVTYHGLNELHLAIIFKVFVDVHAESIRAAVRGASLIFLVVLPGLPKHDPFAAREILCRLKHDILLNIFVRRLCVLFKDFF
jgi:hypothetical protein